MNAKTIYFDNAASSFPKPDAVIGAAADFLRSCGNPGRGAHAFALEGARKIFEAREKVAEFLGVKQTERLVFTPGCTASLNMALKGFAAAGGLGKGDLVIVSSLEHNSMMRPLQQLKETIGIDYAVCDAGESFERDLQRMVDEKAPKLVAVTWASNVTGEVLPISSIAKFLQSKPIPLLVDGAQTAGKLETALDSSGISFFCASGHKGLMGAPGVGVLYVAPDMPIVPLIAGGTGSRSESLEVPGEFPDRLEAGTSPGPAIAALAAGVHWLKTEGISTGLKAELYLTERFLVWARAQSYIKVFGPQNVRPENGVPVRMPVVAFSMDGISPSSLADMLDTEYGIAVRAGLHCAPLCHKQLGTLKEGLVRVSFGVFNVGNEVDALISALEKIRARL